MQGASERTSQFLNRIFPNRIKCRRKDQIKDERKLASRVPEVTFFFWIIKCLATALGETMADQMATVLGDSQGKALAVFGCLTVFFLAVQFALRRYFAPRILDMHHSHFHIWHFNNGPHG